MAVHWRTYPDWDVVAVFTGYFKDDEASKVALQPKLLEVLRGFFGHSEPKAAAPVCVGEPLRV